MSRLVSFRAGLWLASLTLGGCLLADVGIDESLDPPSMTVGSAQGGGSGGSASAAGGAGGGSGGSGSGAMAPAAGSGGGGGSEGNPNVLPPAQGGAAGMGAAGAASVPPNMGNGAGAGGSNSVVMNATELAAAECPDTTDRERACTLYCDAYEAVCRGYSPVATVAGPYDYQNATDCAIFCNLDSGWELGSNSQLDSIKCRCFHAVLASREGPNPHCFHAARIPSGGCQPID